MYHDFIQEADFFIGSTQVLANAATQMGTPGFVIRNGLNDKQVALSEQALMLRDKPDEMGIIRIGYLPGTRTHRADFAVAIHAIIQILEEFPQTILSIRGEFEIPTELEDFQDRIELLPFVYWEDLIGAMISLDINLAPLELDNPYTEAKSALKYFEPALVEIPTIASATEDFRVAIRSGYNGFLATTSEDWYLYLRCLIVDADLRVQMGKAAREHVLRHYTSSIQSVDTINIFRMILGSYQPSISP